MRDSGSKYIKPFLLIILLLCLCAAGLALVSSIGEFDPEVLFGNEMLLTALAMQVFASILFVLVWKTLLIKQADIFVSFFEASSHIGVTLLGKYIPGKVWGLVGRTYLLKGHNVALSTAVNLLFLDQTLTFSSGIVISAIFLSAALSGLWSLFIAFLALAGLVILLKMYSKIGEYFFNMMQSRLKQKDVEKIDYIESDQPSFDPVKPKAFYVGQGIYLIHWIATAIALSLFVYPLIADSFVLNSLLITAAIPLAMLSGFVILWAPGGIGVREGVIIGILSMHLPLDTAVIIAITYRLICIAVDLVFGGIALWYFSKYKLALN